MNPNEKIGVLEEYKQGLKDLVRALQANKNRRDVVALMQELVNRDIGRILGIGLSPNWQGEDKELSQRIKSILEDIRKDAELAGAFVGQEAISPALDFLLASVRTNVEGQLHSASSVPFSVTNGGGNMKPRSYREETTSWEAAVDAALAISGEQLRIMGEEDIRKRHEKLTHVWAGELFRGSTAEIGALLTWNLRRISQEAGFKSFVVTCKNDEGYVDIYADFPRAVVPVEVWRTESAFFVFGNRLFTSPKRETVIGVLRKLFKPDPRTAEIRRLRSLIKENYKKREIMSYLIELERLGDPVAMQIGRAADSNNLAEMQRLIRSL